MGALTTTLFFLGTFSVLNGAKPNVTPENPVLEPVTVKPNYPIIRNQNATITAAVILYANPKRKAVCIYNNGLTTVYLGSNNAVSTSNGLPIVSTSSYSNDHFNATGEYWVIGTATCDLRVEEDLSTMEGA